MANNDFFWPEDFPAPQLTGNKRSIASNTIRVKVDAGGNRVRKTTSATPGKRTYTFIFKGQERIRAFEQFVLAMEGKCFWLPDPANDQEYIKVEILPKSEESICDINDLVPQQVFSVTLDFGVFPHATRPKP